VSVPSSYRRQDAAADRAPRTAGWQRATEEAKQALRRARSTLAALASRSPIDQRPGDRGRGRRDPATRGALSMDINAWEGRWPLNTYARDMDRSA